MTCPACGSSLQIPAQPKIAVHCRCGGRFQADVRLAGKAVNCPKCQQSLHVPESAADSAELDSGASLDDFAQVPVSATMPSPTRIVRPAAASGDGLNRWVIASIIGGGAFVAIFIVAYSAWSWISTPGEESREVAEDVQQVAEDVQQVAEDVQPATGAARAVRGGINAAEDAARKLAETELARLQGIREPSTTGEVERSYQLPEGAKDSTQLWINASNAFYTDQFDADAAGIQIADTSRGYEVPPPGQTWAEFSRAQRLLAKYQQPLNQLHEAARNGGSARYPTQFQDGIKMTMPHLMELMATARVLRLEAHVRGHQGDITGAATSVDTIFAAGRSLEPLPHFVGQLVSWSTYANGVSALEDLLPYLEFSNADLKRLAESLDKSDADRGLYRALVGERALGLQSLQTPAALTAYFTTEDVEESRRLTKEEARGFARVAAYVKERDRWALLLHMRGLIEASRKPWPQRLFSAEQVQRDWEDQARSAGLKKEDVASIRHAADTEHADFAIIVHLIVPAYSVSFDSHARFIALRELTKTALAIERYRNQGNQLPNNLEQLASQYLSSVPIDPYSGKPIRYLRDANGYRVYSVGRNRVDDGGRGTLSGVDEDIVFVVPFAEKNSPPAIAANTQPGASPNPGNSGQPRPGRANPPARRRASSSPPIGVPVGKTFEDGAPSGGYLVGLRVVKGSNWGGVVHAIQPIYRVGNETIEGKLVGGMEDKGRNEAIAKPGYAVGGIHARRGAVIDSVKLTFYRIKGTKMDRANKY